MSECVKKYVDSIELELDLIGDLANDATLENVNETIIKIENHQGFAEKLIKEARTECNIESGTFRYQRNVKKD